MSSIERDFCASHACHNCELKSITGCLLSPWVELTDEQRIFVDKTLKKFVEEDNRKLTIVNKIRYIFNNDGTYKVVFEEDFSKAKVKDKILELEKKYGKGKIFATLSANMYMI